MTGFAPQQVGIFTTAVSLTTTATWTDFAAPTSALTFVKNYPASTSIHVRMHWSYFCNTVGTVADIGFSIGGTTYLISSFYFSQASVHHRQAGEAIVSGFFAGSYVIQPRWRTSVSGLRTDASDMLYVTATEVPAPPQ